MEYQTKRSVEVVLFLDEEEAKWLKNVMQNHMVPAANGETEPAKHKEMRKLFWETLNSALGR